MGYKEEGGSDARKGDMGYKEEGVMLGREE